MVTSTKLADAPQNRFPGGGGSRRDIAARDRVVAATRDLLAEVGFANLSVEAVAARAGVGKPTIYRWWSNKAHLAYEASCLIAQDAIPPDSGHFITDIRRFVERVADFLWRDEVNAALRGMLADADVSRRLEVDRMNPARDHLRAIVEKGIANGEVRQDADADTLFEMAVGTILLQTLASGKRPRARRRAVASLVDALRRAACSGG